MSRRQVRDFKRALHRGVAAGAQPQEVEAARSGALALLERSIELGHGRLAVARLLTAIQCGAEVKEAHWTHCRRIALVSRDPRSRELFTRAVQLVPQLQATS